VDWPRGAGVIRRGTYRTRSPTARLSGASPRLREPHVSQQFSARTLMNVWFWKVHEDVHSANDETGCSLHRTALRVVDMKPMGSSGWVPTNRLTEPCHRVGPCGSALFVGGFVTGTAVGAGENRCGLGSVSHRVSTSGSVPVAAASKCGGASPTEIRDKHIPPVHAHFSRHSSLQRNNTHPRAPASFPNFWGEGFSGVTDG
jgi:hypothetical protein